MGIKYVSGYNLIPEAVREFQERVENATVYYFSYMGEKLAKYAKEMHSYTDRTGNLTNSIGYAVVKGGKIINTGGMMGSSEAKAASLQVLQEMMDRINHQFALIIIAGCRRTGSHNRLPPSCRSSGRHPDIAHNFPAVHPHSRFPGTSA